MDFAGIWGSPKESDVPTLRNPWKSMNSEIEDVNILIEIGFQGEENDSSGMVISERVPSGFSIV